MPNKYVYKTRKVELETEDRKAPVFAEAANFEFYETYYEQATMVDYYWNPDVNIYAQVVFTLDSDIQ